MNFFEKILTGRLFSRKKKPEEKEPEVVSATLNEVERGGEVVQASRDISSKVQKKQIQKQQLGTEMIIQFSFMGKTYIVEDFDLKFVQDVDERKNRPGSLPYGGIMSITISETPDFTINEWMMQSSMVRDGEIHFFANNHKITDSSLVAIYFGDAYCVGYKKKINTSGPGLLTTLVVSPRIIKIGNEEFENNWKKNDNYSYYIKSV